MRGSRCTTRHMRLGGCLKLMQPILHGLRGDPPDVEVGDPFPGFENRLDPSVLVPLRIWPRFRCLDSLPVGFRYLAGSQSLPIAGTDSTVLFRRLAAFGCSFIRFLAIESKVVFRLVYFPCYRRKSGHSDGCSGACRGIEFQLAFILPNCLC